MCLMSNLELPPANYVKVLSAIRELKIRSQNTTRPKTNENTLNARLIGSPFSLAWTKRNADRLFPACRHLE